MKRDTRCLIAALVLLALSLTSLTAGIQGRWLSKFPWLMWIFNIMFFGYVILFIAFLYFNHALARESPSKSLRGYKIALLLCIVFIVVGAVCMAADFDFYRLFGNVLISGSIFPLMYALLGYYDIKKHYSNKAQKIK